MKKNIYKFRLIIVALVSSVLLFNSCLNDLDQFPPKDKSEGSVVNEQDAMAFLAKIYSGFGLSGNKGPADDHDRDLQGPDQGALVFLRGLLSMQLYTTDEAMWNWADAGIPELNYIRWDYTHQYVYTFYQRVMLNIAYSNKFLNLYPANSGIANIEKFRDEVRGLRAMNYYYLIDIYGNPGVVWDDSPTSDVTWMPSQMGRGPLFDKIVTELLELSEVGNLDEQPTAANYGRMTKPVINTILAKMYLNAEVYKGTPMYDKAAEYAKKVIDAGFGLEDNYSNLFCGENHKTAVNKKEIIFPIIADSENALSYGNSIMVTAAAYGGTILPQYFGLDASWTCLKPRENLIQKFEGDFVGTDRFKNNIKADKRYLFWDVKNYDTDNAPSGIDNLWPFDPATGKIYYDVKDRREVKATMGDWNTGYGCVKFTNLGWSTDGKPVKVTPTAFPDTDFPLFRLADIYLIYAECAVRGAADKATGLGYVNQLRERAYGNKSGNITMSQMTEQFILDERARELYWEGQRRSDLIRFNQYTKNYAWALKGGTADGVADIDDKYKLFPISDKDLTSNKNLEQNPGYASLK